MATAPKVTPTLLPKHNVLAFRNPVGSEGISAANTRAGVGVLISSEL